MGSAGTVIEGYTYLGLNTIVQESHPQTGVDLTYISQSGDTSAPPAYAATGGDRYVGLDQFGRVDDQFYVNPTYVTSPTDRFQYSYDQDSNVLYKDVVEMGGTAATFSQLYHASAGLDSDAFDGQDRMTSFEQGTLSHTNASNGSGVLDTVATSTATQALTLDSLGNWDGSSVTGIGTTEARTFNAQNQITNNSGSTTPTYDNNGNVTEDDTGATYTYSAWDQLATTSAGYNWRFSYLPNGPQASMSTCCGSTVTTSYYSTDWQDLEDVPPSGHESTYVWGLENQSELVERDDTSASVRLYAQHDANMDITALVNTSGSVVERFSYTPSGIATVLSPSWSATTDSYNWLFRWQGGRYNTTDGLYTFGYRNYSPTLGTWMQEDPTGYAAGPNVYQAMLGAPIENTDPYGLDPAAPNPAPSGGVPASGSTGGGTAQSGGGNATGDPASTPFTTVLPPQLAAEGPNGPLALPGDPWYVLPPTGGPFNFPPAPEPDGDRPFTPPPGDLDSRALAGLGLNPDGSSAAGGGTDTAGSNASASGSGTGAQPPGSSGDGGGADPGTSTPDNHEGPTPTEIPYPNWRFIWNGVEIHPFIFVFTTGHPNKPDKRADDPNDALTH
jgi:RHS repeat-associated protein